jgi:hypothetical protein
MALPRGLSVTMGTVNCLSLHLHATPVGKFPRCYKAETGPAVVRRLRRDSLETQTRLFELTPGDWSRECPLPPLCEPTAVQKHSCQSDTIIRSLYRKANLTAKIHTDASTSPIPSLSVVCSCTRQRVGARRGVMTTQSPGDRWQARLAFADAWGAPPWPAPPPPTRCLACCRGESNPLINKGARAAQLRAPRSLDGSADGSPSHRPSSQRHLKVRCAAGGDKVRGPPRPRATEDECYPAASVPC